LNSLLKRFISFGFVGTVFFVCLTIVLGIVGKKFTDIGVV